MVLFSNISPNEAGARGSDYGVRKATWLFAFSRPSYLATLFWIVVSYLLYFLTPYYQHFLVPYTRYTLIIIALFYIFGSPVRFYIYSRVKGDEGREFKVSKSVLALRFFQSFKNSIFHGQAIAFDERVAVLFTLVKFFYTPLMINFLFSNFSILQSTPLSQYFSFLLVLLFTIDTFIFTLGYLVESTKLGNVVRSVEPTFFGWVVALVCYPPFNGLVGQYVPWGANDFAVYSTPWLTFGVRVVLILLLVVYVSASVALGFKASNLTNRGIVSRGPYAVIRHPAYVSKILFWWITLLAVFSWPFFFGMFFWTLVYFFRAITEERHLGSDPEYKEYCRKVKYRFIPGIV